MSVPLCHFCGGDPMLDKGSFSLGATDEAMPLRVVIYQCDQCKRIEVVIE